MADQETENQKQRNELKREELRIEEDLAETEKERLEVSEKILRLEEKNLATAREQLQEARADAEERRKYVESLEKSGNVSEEILELEKEKLEKIEYQVRGLESAVSTQEKFVEEKRRELEVMKETVKIQEEQLDILIKARDRGEEQVRNALNLSDAWKQGTFGIMMQAKELGVQAEAMGAYLKGAKSAVTINSLVGNTLELISTKTIEVAKAQDDAVSQFAKSTGAGRSYADVIRTVNVENRKFGVDAQDASHAAQALYQNFASLDAQSSKTQANLIGTAAKLDEIGVSATTSADTMFTLHRTFNMSADAAAATAMELSELTGSGMTTNEVFEALNQNASHFARYSGPQAVETFKEMAHMARNTGIEMSTLVGVAEQFDTFDSAAQTVGRLNAVFGGPYLNTLDMMNKTTDEQVQELHKLFKQTGMNFDQLGKFEKMMIANTMGFENMKEASEFFNTSLADLTKRNKEMEETEERIQAAQSVMEKLEQIAQTFAITLGPLVDMVSEAASALLELEEYTRFTIGGFDIGVVSIAAMAIAAFKLIAPIKALAGVFSTAMVPAMKGVTAVAPALGSSLGGAGIAMKPLILPVLSIGAALLAAGFGFKLAAEGASMLVDSISQLSVEQLGGLAKVLLTTSLLAPAAPFLMAGAIAVTTLAGAYYLLAQAIEQIDLEKLNAITSFNNSVISLAETGADSVETVKKVVEVIRETVVAAEDAGGEGTIQKIREMIEVILGGTAQGGTAATGAGTGGAASALAKQEIHLDFMLGNRSIKKMVYDLIDDKFTIGGNDLV